MLRGAKRSRDAIFIHQVYFWRPVVPSGAAKYDDEGDARSEQNPASNVETSIVHPALFKVDFL